MNESVPFRARISERIACEVPVLACTTLDSRRARVVDYSMHGAQIWLDKPYAAGDRIHLDVEGEYVWAQVQWAEIDRMGVRFLAPMNPEHRLARIVQEQQRHKALASARRQPVPILGGFGKKAA